MSTSRSRSAWTWSRQALRAAARKYGRVVQVGTQRRSTPHIVEARDRVVRAGRLGKIALVEAAEAGARRFNKFRPTAAQVLEGYVDLAEVYLAMWEHADAPDTTMQGSVKQALKALQGFAKTFPIGRPSLLRLQGLYARLTGNPAKAHRLWQTSLAEAERLSMPYERALAHYEIGRWVSGGDRGKELNCALDLFQQLGASYDAALVKDLL